MERKRKQPRLDRAELVRQVRALLPAVRAIWLYGSFASGTAGPESDVDLAVLADRPLDPGGLLDPTLELEGRFGRPVQLVDLRAVSTVLRFEAVARGELLWAADPEEAERMALAWIAMYQHQNEAQREHLAEIRERGTVF